MNNEVKRALKIYEDAKRQIKTFSEQGEIGLKIAKKILKKLTDKNVLTEYMTESIAKELKI